LHVHAPAAGGYQDKRAILSLVECGGSVLSFHMEKANKAHIGEIVAKNVHRESKLMTDEAGHYKAVGRLFADHKIVAHTRGE
jgi:hypothetical protein